jgi:hypothetical protein
MLCHALSVFARHMPGAVPRMPAQNTTKVIQGRWMSKKSALGRFAHETCNVDGGNGRRARIGGDVT